MRLLVDAHVFDEAPQGTRTYIKGIYTEIISTKDTELEIYFCANNIENLKREFGEYPGVFYLKLESSSRIIRLAFEFRKLIKRHKIDVAHFQYITPLFKTCKEIVTIHDLLFLDYPDYFPLHYRLYKSFLFKRSAKRADLVLTVSEFSKSSIRNHFHIPSDRIQITPNAVFEDFFLEIDISQKIALRSKYGIGKFILYVSRIEPRKNQVILLRAFHELELWKKGYELVFIGRTDIKAIEFTNYFSALNEDVKHHIRILEDIPFTEIIVFYKSCELFVYPSLAEGFGIPPLEAAAAQSPVLCSNVTAMKDFIFFKDSFFDPNDLGELKVKIIERLNKRDVVQIRNNQTLVRDKYNWRFVADRFIKNLKNIKIN